jgi:hypothetical protein
MSRNVQAVAGVTNVQLPGGAVVNGSGTLKADGVTVRGTGDIVTLTDAQFQSIPSQYFTVYITDAGPATGDPDQVQIQGVDVPNLSALTSAQVGAAPTQANFNALQVDVAADHAALQALLTSLRGVGKPMA